ncbi:MAG: hypothetical protein DRR08_01260 [Candidatus Parabeggiatoa sp. nov. 2]|nr:MAG: hypothetical protein B6247_01395 [Beggiatoa sp. 4572_84]RKZ64246.1 MAG: hypothetical protein DRR08_01260 [Gammaproteobacteria bacterium]
MQSHRYVLLGLVLVISWMPLGIAQETTDTTSKTTETLTRLTPPAADADDLSLIQYALRLREMLPQLFMGAKGLLIYGVGPNSQAEAAKLQRGDIVIAYAGHPTNTTEQFVNTISLNANKPQLELRFIRANRVHTVVLHGGSIGIHFADITEELASKLFLKALIGDKKTVILPAIRTYPQTAVKAQQWLLRKVADGDEAANYFQFISELLTLYFQKALITLGEEGLQAEKMANDLEALKFYQKGLKNARQLNDKAFISLFFGYIGRIYQKRGQSQQALEYFQQALEITRDLRDKFGEATHLTNLGLAYQALAQYQQALGYFQQALTRHRDIGDQRREAGDLTNIGVVYQETGESQQALEYFQQALVILRNLGNKHNKEAEILNNIGVAYQALAQYQQALGHFQQALVILRNLGNKHNEEAEILNNIGAVYQDIGESQQALEYYQQALVIHRKSGHKRGEAAVFTNLGILYQETLAQYQKALEYHQQALTIHREIGDKDGIGSNLSGIGAVYQDIGETQQALEYYQQALTIHRNIGDQRGEAGDLTNLGLVYEHVGKYQQALDHFQQALAICRKINDRYGESAVLSNIGVNYIHFGQYQQALEHLQQSLNISREIGNPQGESSNLSHIGSLYQLQAQYLKALDFYQQAVAIRHKIGDIRGEAADINNIGVLYETIGDGDKALASYQKSLDIKRQIGNRAGEAATLTNIGNVYAVRGEYSKALEYHQQALEINRYTRDRSGESACLTNIASIHQSLGHSKKALDFNQQALVIAQQIGNRQSESAVLNNIGIIYQTIGQSQQARKNFQQAQSISREIGDRRGEAMSIGNIGGVYADIGNYQQALQHFQQALSIHREIGALENVAGSLLNIGTVYLSFGQYLNALDYFQQALDILRRLDYREGESTALGNIGAVYETIGQYDKALDFQKKALAIDQAIGNRHGEASGLHNISVVYVRLERYEKALEYSQQGLNIFREMANRQGEGLVLNSLGIIHEKLGQSEKALDYYQQALAINREIDNRLLEGFNLANIGEIYRRMGRYKDALPFFQKGTDILTNLNALGTLLWEAQKGLAAVEVQLKQFDAAIKHYEQALENIDALRAGLTEKAHKLSFMRDKMVVYDEFIALLQTLHSKHPDKGYDRKALEVFERKQGRIFLEEMGQSGARQFAGLPAEISQAERELESQRVQTRKQLLEERSKFITAQNPAKLKFGRQREQELEAQQQALQAKIKQQYPEYYALKYPQPVQLDTLQKNVLRDDELMLVYGVMKDSTTLWVIGQKTFQMFNLPLSETALEDKVAQLRQLMGTDDKTRNALVSTEDSSYLTLMETDNSVETEEASRGARRRRRKKRERKPDPLAKASKNLYTQLLPEQVRPLLTAPYTVYVIPTGPLYVLPFETLVTQLSNDSNNRHYLIEDVPIAYLSSASLLKTLREAQQRRQKVARYPFLAFANPVYEAEQTASVSKTDEVLALRSQSYRAIRGSDFAELPETEDEAKEIAALLNAPKENEPVLQLREAASRPTVFQLNDKKRLDDYQTILFAAHGILPGEIDHITQSALVLSHPDTLGYLTMADVFALQLNAKLVSLSACNTGRGKRQRGEGVMGLTRAFMYAGTPRVAVTLWAVESYSAKRLSVGFFKQLKNLQKPAAALRAIKLRMLRGEEGRKYKRPYYWAPFVVFGEASGIQDLSWH